ncbi:DUF3945 domain-containing protein [Bacteroides fragilis]|uniref:DUF3945 domain-containing protein n=1 Tax=Bacteroides fragilis TaxID=817 RepID=UPI00202F4276|nr:DUF3945 domain-containing protein [Bacteroides fragilis]MCM0301921.1 DUF3945 domain-containing protein [Bacteroides fragilis]
MDEKQKKEEQKVLLVVAKTDNNQLKVVHKSSAKTGIMKSLLPSIENLEDFMKIEKHSNMLETFFTNFMHQCKNPTDFRFYHLPAALLDKLDILQDMLKSPEENKDFLAQYEVKPEDYIKPEQQVEQKTGTEPELPKEQPNSLENRIDWEQLARLGINRESLEQSGDLQAILSGNKSGLVAIDTQVEGIPISTQGRIYFQEGENGKLDLKIDCCRREPALDLPFHGTLLSEEVQKNILANGNAGHPVNLSLKEGETTTCLVSLDKLTNNLVAVPVNDILIPHEIKGVTLTPEQHKQLTGGGKVLVEGMTSQWNTQFDGYIQYNAAKEKLDFTFDGLDRNRYKAQTQQQMADQKIFIPKKLLGAELTPEQQKKFQEGGTIYVQGMKDKQGQPFNAYVKMNFDKAKPEFFKWNPDKVRSAAKEVTPTAEHKTQVAVNNGATDETTKNVKEPLKANAQQPVQTQAAKGEKKKVKSRKI